jgi:hypothetical protein
MQDKKQVMWIVVILIIMVILISFFAYASKPEPGKYDTFAQCVASKGLTMYGSEWCGHCANEKKAFGDSFRFINYVECPDNIKLCTDKGINGYPTWMDNLGNKYEGARGLKGIAEITGCELPE